VVVVPLFYGGHVHLWQTAVAVPWPVMPVVLADALTLLAIAALVAMLLGRWLVKAGRQLTARDDVAVLVVLLILCASGYLAAHPTQAPFSPRGLLLVHMLAGNLTLVMIPTTKIVHCILMPLTQWISELGWHFPASSGRDVAVALHKENEPV
jgi:nitrate reductase gamma subunit